MKKLFLLIILYSVLCTSTYAQWWVSGGNLIWPYGDVSINKNLNVDGTINGAKYYVFLFSHDGGTGNPTVTDLFNNIGSHNSWTRVSAGVYRTSFSDLTFNTKVFNTRSVTLDASDTQILYMTYTDNSYLYIQVNDFQTLSYFDPNIQRLPILIMYYP